MTAEKGISITKSQVEFNKSIKSKGTYRVGIKLTTKLKLSKYSIFPGAPQIKLVIQFMNTISGFSCFLE